MIMEQNLTLIVEFVKQSILRIEENTPKIEKCLAELSEEEIWKRPNASSNSIGNLVLHLCGNITQYIIATLGEKEDERDRDAEFDAREGYSKSALTNKLKAVVSQAVSVIKSADSEMLLRKRRVQIYEFTGIGIIIHVAEHYSYHTGQIVFWTKLLKDKDLGFYANLDLNTKFKM